MSDLIQSIEESIKVKQAVLADQKLLKTLEVVAELCVSAYKTDNQMLFCGNGGSAADAQHLAAELLGRFYIDRPPLRAEALHTNTSYMTAVANDYSYDEVFARMLRAKARKGDILFAISTSGNSPNILKAVEAAKETGVVTVGMTGSSGGSMRSACDYLLNIPSADTPRIQECHILFGHIICHHIEQKIFG